MWVYCAIMLPYWIGLMDYLSDYSRISPLPTSYFSHSPRHQASLSYIIVHGIRLWCARIILATLRTILSNLTPMDGGSLKYRQILLLVVYFLTEKVIGIILPMGTITKFPQAEVVSASIQVSWCIMAMLPKKICVACWQIYRGLRRRWHALR